MPSCCRGVGARIHGGEFPCEAWFTHDEPDYVDEYARVGETWKFSKREEKSLAFEGGEFAAILRKNAASSGEDHA